MQTTRMKRNRHVRNIASRYIEKAQKHNCPHPKNDVSLSRPHEGRDLTES
uniref:Uncharacterized protein n=1 Tax=Amphimedon queenslandica TaxID=400682 RepID=A0A1X7TTY5_AMPQE